MAGTYLMEDGDGIAITDGEMIMRADFAHMKPRLRPDRLRSELLLRAAGIRGGRAAFTRDGEEERTLRVIDATAGMGEDSLLLAAAGCEVRLYERDGMIAALLRDALRKAGEDPDLTGIAARMQLIAGDSIGALPGLRGFADVILLDPMFPGRRKSGLVKKKFQLLHDLEKPCEDEEALFAAAEAAEPRRIVVKRPLKGPLLAGRKPAFSLPGKTIRYDCYLFP